MPSLLFRFASPPSGVNGASGGEGGFDVTLGALRKAVGPDGQDKQYTDAVSSWIWDALQAVPVAEVSESNWIGEVAFSLWSAQMQLVVGIGATLQGPRVTDAGWAVPVEDGRRREA